VSPGGTRSRLPRAYTPRHLAERILKTRSALEGERKQVTVLFADVKGSVELAESVDAEEWHRIMDQFFVIITEGIHRFEGTINQYTGDGVMALFGAPIAHEDHAQRACYAALQLTEDLRRYADQLRRTRGMNFSVRMGLDSGEVVVGKIGDDLRMDYTAQGHSVSLAARMEHLAEPGRVYVTDNTEALVRGLFRLHDLGPFDLKGVGRPVRVHRLESAGPFRSSLDVARSRGFSRFVGRDGEMSSFEAALAHALEGNGQVMAVVGEAGVGKSRLCYEFLERCRNRGLRVHEVHGFPHGRTIPLLPILELLRSSFGITEQDSDQMAREKIAGRLLLLDDAFRRDLPLVFDFLGLQDPKHPLPPRDPEGRQRQLFALVRRLVQSRSRREAAVIAVEDLHWFDSGSEAFIENLVDAIPGTRTLLLVNYRPDYDAPWFRRSYFQQLPLPPLGPQAIDELLADLLGDDASLAPLAAQIRDRTRGNPFFIEEIVQSLKESGVLEGERGAYRLSVTPGEGRLPASVQSVLAARIDRLPEREKHLLQTASVIGNEFQEAVLRHVAGLSEAEFPHALRSLIEGEFLEEQSPYPEPEYTFRHPLTQAVAYRSQLGEAKARVHASVARAIGEVYADRIDERAGLLAHHWEEAGDLMEAARWSRRAADWAGVRDASAALAHWDRVRTLLEGLPDSAEGTELGLASRIQTLRFRALIGNGTEENDRVFAEGRALAEKFGDRHALAVLVSNYGTAKGSQGQIEEQVGLAKEAMLLAEEIGAPGLRLALRQPVAFSEALVGRMREALQLTEDALQLAREDPTLGASELGFSPYVWFLGFRGVLLNSMARPEEGARDLDRALQLAREHDESETLVWTHGGYADLAFFTGETQMALGHCRRGADLADQFGSPYWRAAAHTWLGHAYVLNQDWSNALAALEKALELARTRKTVLELESRILCHLGQAYLGAENHEDARRCATEAIEVARRRRTRWHQCRAEVTLAHVLARTDGLSARATIETALRRATALVAETGAAGYEPFISLERGEVARLAGDRAGAEHEVREALRLFARMGASGHAERLAATLH
jgi:class 3 adenylate cyclase/tetratricopeptide (TPR) repeat protein